MTVLRTTYLAYEIAIMLAFIADRLMQASEETSQKKQDAAPRPEPIPGHMGF